MEQKDIFCDREKIKSDILAETDNWMVKVGFGLVTPGHVIAIPRQHFDCFVDIEDSLLDEFEKTINPALQKYITERFSRPFGIEYGFGQTVEHAHVHFIPSTREGYNVNNVVDYINSLRKTPLERINRETLRNVRLSV